jgi:hypothetical protein
MYIDTVDNAFDNDIDFAQLVKHCGLDKRRTRHVTARLSAPASRKTR